MTTKELEKLYLANEEDLRNILRSQDIYDEDLFQDTCLALCEFAQHNEIVDFRQSFLDKYDALIKHVGRQEIDCVHLDNAQLAELEIIDESQDVEIIDRDIDLLNELRSDEYKEQLRKMLNYYCRHPQPGERNHKQACKVLRYFLNGKSEREISHKLNISQQAVHQHIVRLIARLKVVTLGKYNRGA